MFWMKMKIYFRDRSHILPFKLRKSKFFQKESNTRKKHMDLLCTVLCKSKANEFCLKRYFNQISPHFRDTYCFYPAIFRMIICFARWFIPHFRAIICSSRKVAVIFRTIIRSSRKFNLLFINRPRAFLKHSSLTEIPKWPFQLLCTKQAINLLK